MHETSIDTKLECVLQQVFVGAGGLYELSLLLGAVVFFSNQRCRGAYWQNECVVRLSLDLPLLISLRSKLYHVSYAKQDPVTTVPAVVEGAMTFRMWWKLFLVGLREANSETQSSGAWYRSSAATFARQVYISYLSYTPDTQSRRAKYRSSAARTARGRGPPGRAAGGK